MKKAILCLLSVAMITNVAKAQITIAPELGLNLANEAITGASTTVKAGLGIGVIADYKIKANLYLQPGLFYLMNGCTYSGGSQNINTLEIPINIEYKLGDDSHNRFFFGAGIYFGYNISGKDKDNNGTYTMKFGATQSTYDSVSGNSTNGDDYKTLDFGLGLNAGYLLKNGFYARARYQFGLKNMDPNAIIDNSSYKTSAFGLTVGYYLPSKKAKNAVRKK